MSTPADPPERPLYTISVAAELVRLPVPTLRLYEEKGLVLPQRTDGGTRRYSDADLARIARISELVASGVTLAAVAMVLDLQDDNADLASRNRSLRERNTALRQDNERLRDRVDGDRVDGERVDGDRVDGDRVDAREAGTDS
jgi:MerR family transcriptional regulator, heat shock protein HspR